MGHGRFHGWVQVTVATNNISSPLLISFPVSLEDVEYEALLLLSLLPHLQQVSLAILARLQDKAESLPQLHRRGV